MALNVHFYRITFSEHYDEFRSLLDPEIQITVGTEIPSDPQYEVLIYPTPTEQWIKASPNLRAVVIPWTGVPEKTLKLLLDYPKVSLHNLHHNNVNTAELGFALLLAAAKFIVPLDQALRQNDWTPRFQEQKSILLKERTALILGFGEIGQILAEYCLGLGMTVLAIKKHPNAFQSDLPVKLHGPGQLQNLLPQAEVVLISLPLTEETEGLIGKKELALMPKGSILVNIGRGPIVDQFALYAALKNGHLRAAASDVWYHYPDSKKSRVNTPPADVPFGELDNFVLSPHRGGMVDEEEHQLIHALADLLNKANRGEKIPNRVDLNAGY